MWLEVDTALEDTDVAMADMAVAMAAEVDIGTMTGGKHFFESNIHTAWQICILTESLHHLFSLFLSFSH